MSPLHGDSDLYVSRYHLFPNKTNTEKSSLRVGSFSDHIEFSKTDNGTLATTYYISVFGYTYATYSLLAHVHRTGGSNEERTKSVFT